jgi:Ca2+-binding RTX toxin-like protein
MSDDNMLSLDDDILDRSTILDRNTSHDFIGTPENDNVIGGYLDDTIRGGEGDDLLIGGGGNNLLFGDEGNDTLSGASIDLINNDDVTLDRQGIDTLTGGTGADSFVLGGNLDSIINSSDSVVLYASAGNDDYALITDFDPSEDKIVLGGSKNDYTLGSSSSGLPEGTGIFRQEELIAIVQGNSELSLSEGYFET